MIRRIHLTNWRAYESAQIPLETGTTFIVAPNGIGKTSLLEAAQFAITGKHDRLVSPISLGEEKAVVEIALQLPDTRVLVVERTLFSTPGVEPLIQASINGVDLDEAAVAAEIENAFHAGPDFISRNALLLGSLRDGMSMDLREQLAKAFGLADKRSFVEELDRSLGPLEAEAVELTRSLRRQEREVGGIEGELAEAEIALTSSTAQLVAARETLSVSAEAQERFNSYKKAAKLVQRWDEDCETVLAAAREYLPQTTADKLSDDLESRLSDEEAQLASLRQEVALLQAKISLSETSHAALMEAGASCPVCLRAFDGEVRGEADAAHRQESDELRRRLEAIDLQVLESRVLDLRKLLRRCDALGDRPLMPPESDGAVEDSESAFGAARSSLEAASAHERTSLQRVADLSKSLAEARDLEQKRSESVSAWRRWALASAASSTLSGAIEELLNAELEPIAAAIDDRWTRLFPDRPELHFDLDGNPWRPIGTHRLDIEAFSAGEQIAARLLMQLAILTTATSVNFCWIDEPLEHLDPKTRRLVGGMLSQGRKAFGLRQLVVTTYEEELAQYLAEADEETHIEFVRVGRPSSPASNSG